MRHHDSLTRAAALLVGALALGACKGPATGAPPRPTPSASVADDPATGFPDLSTDDAIWVEAVYPTNSGQLLGVDLTARGILPVFVRLGLTGAASPAGLRLRRDTFDPRLYLHNGMALGWVGPDAMGERWELQRAAGEHTLPLGPLPVGNDALEGFLFFDLGDLRVREHFAVVGRRDARRELDLEKALFSFQVESGEGAREVRVGLRSDYFAGTTP